MNHINCPLCLKDVSRQSFNKHFFSREHLELWVKPALLKEKDYLKTWSNSTKSSSCPYIQTKDNKTFIMCFGCKKANQSLPSFHLSDCPEADTHIATLKQMITAVETSDPTEELIRLRKKNKTLLEENENYITQTNDLGDKNDALIDLIKEMVDEFDDDKRHAWLQKLDEIRYD